MDIVLAVCMLVGSDVYLMNCVQSDFLYFVKVLLCY